MAVQYFENNVFDGATWQSSVIQTPDGLEKKFDELHLVGRTIVDAQFVGIDFEWTVLYKRYRNRILGKTHPAIPVARQSAEIDEPIIFTLDDGRQIDVDYTDGSTFCIAENTIPLDIKSYQREDAINGRQFFRNILNAQITRIIVNRTDIEPDFTGAFGRELNEDGTQDEFIDSVIFEMSNGFQIYLTSYLDYGHVHVLKNGQETHFKELWKNCWYVGHLKHRKMFDTPIVAMDTCKVLYANWEMQCCGDSFHVGSHVTWLGSKCVEDYFSEYGGMVDFQYRAHYSYEELTRIRGVVKSITALYRIANFATQEQNAEKSKMLVIKSIEEIPECEDNKWQLDGFIVELKKVTVQETGMRLH